MHTENKKYDLIISLGGNCAAAHNLRYRNLRPFSLPFDWVFIEDDTPISYLSEGVKDGFRNLCLFENLVEITDENLIGKHGKFLPYKDMYTGFNFVNHFDQKLINKNVYLPVYNKIRMRVSRLLNAFEKGSDFLFILSAKVPVSFDVIKKLSDVLKSKYPDKNFEFEILLFDSQKDEVQINENIKFNYIKRSLNLYDFHHTNFEWNFLDNVALKRKNNNIKKISLKLFKNRYKITIEKKFSE